MKKLIQHDLFNAYFEWDLFKNKLCCISVRFDNRDVKILVLFQEFIFIQLKNVIENV